MNVATIICWSALLALTSRYAIWYISTFRKALRIEGLTPLPSVRIYTPRYSPLIYVISPYIAPLFKYLPFGWGKWMRYAVRDGTWQHKGTLPRKELGSDVYWLLGPGGPQLWVADADLISDITHRWKDFPKPVMYYTQLQLFGENVLTAEGPLWQFHRKITVRSFNPKNNSLVFTESQEQAKAMVRSWSREKREKASAITVDDLETSVTKLALHIISAAGFGHQMQWHGHETQKVTFAESLKTFVDEIWLLMILPEWFLKFAPSAHLRRVHKAPIIFATHVQKAINETKSGDTTQPKNDLLSNMINSDGISHGSDKGGLSDPEITSNVFIFTLAGHETTATTIQTALVLLAVHPELQQWIHEELDVIFGEKSEGEGLVYESDYPKMRRVMALMVSDNHQRRRKFRLILPSWKPSAYSLRYPVSPNGPRTNIRLRTTTANSSISPRTPVSCWTL
jgi:cytochrome P450